MEYVIDSLGSAMLAKNQIQEWDFSKEYTAQKKDYQGCLPHHNGQYPSITQQGNYWLAQVLYKNGPYIDSPYIHCEAYANTKEEVIKEWNEKIIGEKG